MSELAGIVANSVVLEKMAQWPAHLKTLVPYHSPRAFIAQLVHDSVGKVKGESVGVDDGAHRLAAESVVARPFRLEKVPCAADVFIEAVSGGVGHSRPRDK